MWDQKIEGGRDRREGRGSRGKVQAVAKLLDILYHLLLHCPHPTVVGRAN